MCFGDAAERGKMDGMSVLQRDISSILMRVSRSNVMCDIGMVGYKPD